MHHDGHTCVSGIVSDTGRTPHCDGVHPASHEEYLVLVNGGSFIKLIVDFLGRKVGLLALLTRLCLGCSSAMSTHRRPRWRVLQFVGPPCGVNTP
jgi:hypothetical protein